MDELMIKIDNVKKEYTLGAIGGTTLRDELQRRRARRKHLEDPTRKIGAKVPRMSMTSSRTKRRLARLSWTTTPTLPPR